MARRPLLPLLVAACSLGLLAAGDAHAQGSREVQKYIDVDGDGRNDDVAIGARTVRVTLARGGSVMQAPLSFDAPPSDVVLVAAGNSLLLVQRRLSPVMEITDVFAVAEGTLRAVHQQPTGLMGRDGEWSEHLALIDGSLVRYQGRPGLRYCDGRDAMAFTARWTAGRFQPTRLPPKPRANAKVLRAVRTSFGDQPRPVVFSFDAATASAKARRAEDLAPPVEINDGDTATAWRGGPGDMVRARQRGDHLVRGLVVRLAGPRAELAIEVGDSNFTARLPGRGTYRLDLPAPVASRCATLTVLGSKPVSIADAAVLTDLELAPEGAIPGLLAAIAAGKQRTSALTRLGKPGLDALLAEIRSRTGSEKRRLRLALARLAARGVDIGPEGTAALVEALFDGGTRRGDRTALQTALGRRVVEAAPALGAALASDEVDRDAASVAVRLLNKTAGDRARDALVGSAGFGTRSRRRATAQAIALRPDVADVVLTRLASTNADDASDGRASADLIRALGLAGPRLHADVRVRVADELRRQFATTEAGTAADYELRYRLVAAAARIPEAIDLVRSVLENTASTPRELALRRVAAARLGGAEKGAEALLRLALDDIDPGVRIAAVGSLAQVGGDDPSLDAPLVDKLRSDPWPAARLAAATALGLRCSRSGPADALFAALDEDPDSSLRISAMTSLVQCRDRRIGARLVSLSRDQSVRMRVRIAAAGLVGKLGDASLVDEAIRTFRLAVDEALGNEYAIRLAEAAAASLGQLGSPDAADILLAVARDQTFPQIQVAAIRALGDLCVERAVEPLRILERSGERSVSRQATRSLNACEKR